MVGALLAKKALAAAFDALNRRDLVSFMSVWREDGVFVYPGDIPESGEFKGKAAVEGWFRRFLEQFPTIQFDVRDVCVCNILDVVGTNVGAVHWDIRLINRDGREGRNSGVTVITVERGKVVFAKDFIFDLGDNFRRNWGAV
ncbi:MAG: nuclear transport factor 2 family protein [Candidatus Krumholzibacteria bacterium]|nr:nuclear transport factor 2 family protein [Candidatus Krumholzibacteria bacterium]MDD5348471.1 nuclear transport factor 2 family protein [Candidatus Omnitrophota bacterium]